MFLFRCFLVGLLGRSLGRPGDAFRCLLVCLGVPWAAPGSLLGAFWPAWASAGHPLGPTWLLFGTLGSPWGRLVLAVFRILRLPVGRPLGTLWARLGCFSAPLGLQGALLGRLGLPPGMPLTALRLPDAPEGGTQRSNLGHGGSLPWGITINVKTHSC